MKTSDEIIKEYKGADKRRRDYLWIYYRNLRPEFDEIEKMEDLSL